VKFLVDANLSPRIAAQLRAHGYDAVAVREIGLGDASDDDILDHEQVIISEDTDFGALLSYRKLHGPALILLRSSDPIEPDEQARMILGNLDAIADDLVAGSIAVFARGHLRIRRLPLP
jgi:predicted nuclease of predicted toxin-antitoxin system